MSESVFEVKVLVKGDKPIRHLPWKDCEEQFRKVLKMLHIERRTLGQAIKVGEKHGKVVSCRKVSASSIIEREAAYMESLPLDNHIYMPSNLYSNAVAMDEMIWKKRPRRKNIEKSP